MSPSAVLERSGAGQGSLYHHFRGKADLAAAALREVSAEMSASVDETLHRKRPGDAFARIVAYLEAPRNALRGCRLGRLALECTVRAEDELVAPIRAYFAHLEVSLVAAIDEARASGEIASDAAARDLATALIATVQGGYVLSAVFADAAYMTRATHAAVRLLEAHAPSPNAVVAPSKPKPRKARR